nr:hypothetical protein [Actinomyces sp.]
MSTRPRALLERLYDGLPGTVTDLDRPDEQPPPGLDLYAYLEEVAPWHVTDLGSLDTLPEGSVVVDATETAWQLHGRTWHPTTPTLPVADTPAITYPAVITWTPKENQ